MKEKLDQIKKEVESELRISYDDVTKSNDHVLKDKWNKLWQKKYFKLIKENIKFTSNCPIFKYIKVLFCV